MNVTFLPMMGLVVAAAVFLTHNAAAQIVVDYGAAYSFAVLAGSEITDAGGSTIGNPGSPTGWGNVGLSPAAGTYYAGLLPAQVGGTIYAVDNSGPAGSTGNNSGLLTDAKNAFGAAFTVAGGKTPTASALGLQLGGLTLTPGVYTFDSGTVLLDGTLTLNANGEANPVWIFQAKSDLTTGTRSSVVLDSGVVPCDVLWVVPTQATLGSGSTFDGTIMAGSAVVMDHGATLYGRAWAGTAVTLDDNIISGLPCTSLGSIDTGGTGGTGGTSVPDTGSTLLLLGSGLVALGGLRRRLLPLT
jgi:hypothetical protein